MNPHGRVVGAPVIASHVGGDTAADLVAVEFATGQGVRMLIDIGTNTEVVVTDGDALPRRLVPGRAGLRRRPAALRDVRRRRRDRDRSSSRASAFTLGTIGDVDPVGICGSGLVDVLAELRRARWMNEEGRFRDGLDEFLVAPGAGHHVLARRTRACSPRPRPPTPAASGSCCAASA